MTSPAAGSGVLAGDRPLSHKWVHQVDVLRITDSDRRVLSVWMRAGSTPQRVARRARIVLLLADGLSARETARKLGISAHTVGLWRRRFLQGGIAALQRDAPGRGRKANVTASADARVRMVLASQPPNGRWTVRSIANAIGMSRASVHRVLKNGKLALTRTDTGSSRALN
jgi:transposase